MGGADKILDYFGVVHVFIQGSSARCKAVFEDRPSPPCDNWGTPARTRSRSGVQSLNRVEIFAEAINGVSTGTPMNRSAARWTTTQNKIIV